MRDTQIQNTWEAHLFTLLLSTATTLWGELTWELPLLSISSQLYMVLPCFLRSRQAVSNHRYFGSLTADTSLLWVLRPFCNHSLPLCPCVFLQPRPLFSQPNLAWPPTRPAGHPGCHCASAVAPAAVHQDARAGDLQGQPQSISMHIYTFPSLRRPCLAEAAHLHSQDMAAAHSHAATGTNLVTVLISFLI